MSVRDYYAPKPCGHCGEAIDPGDDNAGVYAMRNGEQMHRRCAELWDAEMTDLVCVNCGTPADQLEGKCKSYNAILGGAHCLAEREA